MAWATSSEGGLKALDTVAKIDPAASPLLQLVEAVAHSRMWMEKVQEDASGLHECFGMRGLQNKHRTGRAVERLATEPVWVRVTATPSLHTA